MINFGYYYYCTIAGHIRCVYRGGEGGNAPSERMGENPRASSRRAAAPPSTADPFAGSDSSADRTVRRAARHGGGVKLLLRCLQSIQCQYYLVFGVVKTVPLCSLSRDCASRSVPALSLCRSLCLSLYLFLPLVTASSFSSSSSFTHHRHWRYNGSTTTWRTVIDTYTYCIYSVYVVPLLLIPRVPTRVVRAFCPHLIPPSLRAPSSPSPRLSLI